MSNKWLSLSTNERISALQSVARKHNISIHAVEKDWWVTVILKAMTMTDVSDSFLFKGGTSLSKGWNLIQRFSEDVDLSIDRNFFLEHLGYSFAKCENKSQIKNLCKKSRDYIHYELSDQLGKCLLDMGVTGFSIENLTTKETPTGIKPIGHNVDPTVIFVHYDSLLPSVDGIDIDHRVKIEISCLSLAEPFETKQIRTLIAESFPDADDFWCDVRTVTPTRTFIEKVLLLNEELQKDHPRTRRMSRHLYDIEKLMNSDYGKQALRDIDLFHSIVEHRRKFYHLRYVDYDKDYPQHISFCPTGEVLELYKSDYNKNMVAHFIYGDALPFEALMNRLHQLQSDIRNME